MSDYTKLKTPGKAGDSQLLDQLRSNLHMFFDWALLGLDYHLPVTTGTIYPFGGNPSVLRHSDDIRYNPGLVWDSFKTNWCWETNTEGDYQPIQISGIYINNIFYPTGTTGNYSYNINYPLGRIVFDNPISTKSVVQCEYSYKYYNVYPDTVQWFKELTERTFRIDDPQYSYSGSGLWNKMPESRAQLPAIIIEPIAKRSWTPYMLGGGEWIWQDVLLHVFAETSTDRDNMMDIFSYQGEKKFFFFDKNIMSQSGVFPLNNYGYLVNPLYNYPYLVNNYLWRMAFIRDVSFGNISNMPQGVYHGSTRWTFQIEFSEI